MVTIAAGWGYIEETDDIERWNADHLIFKSEDLFKLLFE
jgi:hypothetical protein